MSRTIRTDGKFIINKIDQARPRRQHGSFEKAEAEARRLQELYPTETFVISQEVAKVCANG